MKDLGKIGGVLALALTGGLALAVVASVLNGWALMHLWDWFVDPLGVRPIGIAQAIGLAMLVRLVTYEDAATEKRSIGQNIAILLTKPLFAVASSLGIVTYILVDVDRLPDLGGESVALHDERGDRDDRRGLAGRDDPTADRAGGVEHLQFDVEFDAFA